jgi:hypothetical protein
MSDVRDPQITQITRIKGKGQRAGGAPVKYAKLSLT